MEYKTIKNETKIPVIGLGTWQIGGGNEADYSSDSSNIKLIQNAIQLGYTLIDTAEKYAAGHTEELIGQAIQNVPRDKLFIVSKVTSKNLAYDDLIMSAKKSLERLKIDYFDLYLIHSYNNAIPIEETMRAMDFLVDNKLTKFIGVSNFSVKELSEAQKHTKNKIVANQIQYSLITRNKGTYANCINMESEIIPYCQKNDIIIIAYRPLERGALIKNNETILNKTLDSLSKKYNKTKTQIALNWLISKKNIIAIPMSTNPIHQKENLGALGWNLNKEDTTLLDQIPIENNISK